MTETLRVIIPFAVGLLCIVAAVIAGPSRGGYVLAVCGAVPLYIGVVRHA